MADASSPTATVRRVLKRAAERTLAGSGVDRLALAMRRPGVLVLAYHDVVPAGEPVRGDRSLHLPREDFARQLDALQRTHHVVPMADALDGEPADGRRRAVITFDDAYLGAVTAGIEELTRRSLPATVFVAPALLGTVPWWDALSGGDGLAPAVRSHALDVLGGRTEAVLAWAASAGILPARVDGPRIATENELSRAAAHPGITLASHTWSHASLPMLGNEELEAELARPMAWLRERIASTIDWLSYPYGHSSPAVEAATARAGYTGALRVEGGWIAREAADERRFALPRLNVPAGLSADGFRLAVAGVRGG